MPSPDAGNSDAASEALPDVGEVPLAYLLRSPDTALDHAVNRVLGDIENVAENYAAFGNAL
jgi:FXSXX-COOH protein